MKVIRKLKFKNGKTVEKSIFRPKSCLRIQFCPLNEKLNWPYRIRPKNKTSLLGRQDHRKKMYLIQPDGIHSPFM